jgi:hypothetical protein
MVNSDRSGQKSRVNQDGGRAVKAVRFDEYGGVEVLKVVDVPRPIPGP